MSRLSNCVSLASLLLGGCRTKPLGGTFRTLHFDSERRFVVQDRLPQAPASGTSYDYMSGASIDMVSHLQKGKETPAKVMLSLSTGTDRKLLLTLRREEVFRGPYGVVSLEKNCFFVPRDRGYSSSLDVSATMDSLYVGFGPASQLKEIPRTSRLTSVSLIRIFADGPDYVMASSSYEASGKLGSQSLSRVKPGGELLSGRSGMSAGLPRYDLPDMSPYAMPDHLTQGEPFAFDQLAMPSSAKADVLSALVRRYDFDRYLQVDLLRRPDHRDTVMLAPIVLPEDVGLNDECDQNLQEQAATGRTVVR